MLHTSDWPFTLDMNRALHHMCLGYRQVQVAPLVLRVTAEVAWLSLAHIEQPYTGIVSMHILPYTGICSTAAQI